MATDIRGIYKKFQVQRTDRRNLPGEKHHECEYFVLDLTHDEIARIAALSYAISCQVTRPLLSADLRGQVARATAHACWWTGGPSS